MGLRLVFAILLLNILVQGQYYYDNNNYQYYNQYYNQNSNQYYNQNSNQYYNQNNNQYYNQNSNQYYNQPSNQYHNQNDNQYYNQHNYPYNYYQQYYPTHTYPQHNQHQYQHPVVHSAPTYQAQHHGDISVGSPGAMLHLLCHNCQRRRRDVTFSKLNDILSRPL